MDASPNREDQLALMRGRIKEAVASAFPYLDFTPTFAGKPDPGDPDENYEMLHALSEVCAHAVLGEMPEPDGWGRPWV